jgi:hypothetical protein
LRVRVEFTPEEVNPDGFKVHQLVEAGFLRAVSVGFRPLEYTYNAEREGYDFKRAELLEVSVVPVPANQEALIAAGVGGDAARWLRRQLADGREVTTEAEARQIIANVVTDTMAGVVELDMSEAELRLTIHRAVADEVLRTEGRLVDDPEPEAGPEFELLRGAVRQALATVRNEPSDEAALRSKIETMLRERLGQ